MKAILYTTFFCIHNCWSNHVHWSCDDVPFLSRFLFFQKTKKKSCSLSPFDMSIPYLSPVKLPCAFLNLAFEFQTILFLFVCFLKFDLAFSFVNDPKVKNCVTLSVSPISLSFLNLSHPSQPLNNCQIVFYSVHCPTS